MLQTVRNKIITKVASRHIAGPEIKDAIKVCRWAGQQGFGIILSPWAKAIDNDAALRSGSKIMPFKVMLQRYKESIDSIQNVNPNGYVSVKLNAIGYDFGIFRELLEYAASHDVRVHVDSLDPDSVSQVYKFLNKASEFNRYLGCTLPSRWKRSLRDAEAAIDLGIAVRIVKGQWEDTGPDQPDCRQNYVAIAEKLAGRAVYVGVATHDGALAETAVKELTIRKTNCEIEQFFSLPLNGIKLARRLNVPYRLYVAYGHPGIPYNIRFAVSRPSLAVWMGADFIRRSRKPWSN